MTRLTVSLEEDLYSVAKAMAKAEDCSISAAVNKLLRKAIEPPCSSDTLEGGGHPLGPLPGTFHIRGRRSARGPRRRPMTTRLLDGNVIVALCLNGHEHHRLVRAWFEQGDWMFATCSVTQGTLLRLHMRFAEDSSAAAAWRTLQAVCASPRHELWLADFSYLDVAHRYLQGPKQVTDAWLAELARRRGGRLSTLDGALVALQSDVAELIVAQ